MMPYFKLWLTCEQTKRMGGTYNILVAELSELCELLGHEELGHADDHQDGVPHLVTDQAALAVQILLEITDILLELEYFILEHLQLIN